jgi:hypothetical protein
VPSIHRNGGTNGITFIREAGGFATEEFSATRVEQPAATKQINIANTWTFARK